jgi:hypothetical protein
MDFEGMDTAVRALLFGGLFLVALAAALWSIYDSQGRSASGEGSGWGVVWSVVAALGAILVLPALVINAFNLDPDKKDLIDPFSYVAIGGAALAVLATAGYAITRGGGQPVPYPYDPYDPYRTQQPTPPPQPEPQPVADPTITFHDEEEGLGHPKTMVLKRPAKRFAYLIVQSGLRAGAPFQLSDVTNIGRTGLDNEIVLDDDSVSEHHARVRYDGERKRFIFRDLDSTNGSWLVGTDGKQQIEAPHLLSDGDVLELGLTRLVFKEMAEGSQSQDQPRA